MGVELHHLIIAGRVHPFGPVLGRWASQVVFCICEESQDILSWQGELVLMFIGGLDLLAVTYLMSGTGFFFFFSFFLFRK